MPKRKKESKHTGNAQQHEGFVFGDHDPIVIEHGKKFAAYDKRGRLIILGYNRRIVQEYANAQSKIRFKR